MKPALFLPVAALALASAACDAQAPTDYLGEPLFATLGNVELEPGTDTKTLQPALAFLSPENAGLAIVETKVTGEFPNRFELALYAPPPADALITYDDPRGKVRVAFGFVTAVNADHPDFAPIVSEAGVTTRGLPEATCPDDGCIESNRWCIGKPDDLECYAVKYRCQGPDDDVDDCEIIEREGDESIRDQPWATLAGVSQNYAVLYAEAPLPADSKIAQEMGFHGAVSAGYHLIEVLEPANVAEEREAVMAPVEDPQSHAITVRLGRNIQAAFAL